VEVEAAVDIGHGLVLPSLTLTACGNYFSLRSSACIGQECRVAISEGLVSESAMQSNFCENLSLVFPHIEHILVGERSSEAAKWFVHTQMQLNCLIRRAELFSVRSGRERFLEVVVFFNVELRSAVVFAPGANGLVLRYIQNVNSVAETPNVAVALDTAADNTDMVVPVPMPECVGCFSTCIDLVEGDPNSSDSFGRPNNNIARQEINAMKNLLRQLTEMSEFKYKLDHKFSKKKRQTFSSSPFHFRSRAPW
jgi:hypothetical protein